METMPLHCVFRQPLELSIDACVTMLEHNYEIDSSHLKNRKRLNRDLQRKNYIKSSGWCKKKPENVDATLTTFINFNDWVYLQVEWHFWYSRLRKKKRRRSMLLGIRILSFKLQYIPFQKGVLTENVLAFLFCNDGAVAHCSYFPLTEHMNWYKN